MDLRELESYRLSDAVKFNDKLNPRLWGSDEHLLPDVREKLLAIAADFKEFLGIDLEVKDITISGSNSAYTYTPHSDIDLHLVADLPKADGDDIYRELFDAKKYQYNDQFDFKIGPYDIELYVQNANEPHHSQGIYSVLNNEWVRVPSRRKPSVDDISVRSKYEDIGNRIEQAIRSGDLERMDAISAKLKSMRQAGLDQTGEFGAENLAFKVLRGNGTLQKLRDARSAAKEKAMSIKEQESEKKRKPNRWGEFGGMWFPGFDYYAQGAGEAQPEGVQEAREPADPQQVLMKFAEFVAEQLGIESMPRIKFKKDPAWSQRNNTFGRYVPEEGTLYVSLTNRHLLDIMRTMAHELTHHRQHEVNPLPDDSGETGSPWENEANAKAGEIMRQFADLHPEYFREEPVDEGWRQKAGAVAAAACVAGAPGCATTDGVRTVQDVGRTAQTFKGYNQGAAKEELLGAFKDALRKGSGTRESRVQEASGYIPTNAEKNDPRFKMALTVDIKPGQTGKEANKLGLKTNSQGRPELLMKRLGNLLESVKAGEDLLEYRDRMYQYLKSIVPSWPDYVVKDWLYANFARGDVQGKNWSFETIGKDIPLMLKDMGLSINTKWQLVPNMQFTMDMWEPMTLKRLQARAGGNAQTADPDVHIPAKDAQRHSTQAQLAQQQGGVRDEPVIIVKTPKGYELVEGWHRTIQHFKMYPNGYQGPAYVAQSQTGLTESKEDLFEVKMSPSELRQWAKSPEAEGIRSGFEAELIFRDTAGGDDDDEMSPDYDTDERATDIDSVIEFFENGDDPISRSYAARLRGDLYEAYRDWKLEQIEDDWQRNEEDQVRSYMEVHVWEDNQDEYRERAADALDIDLDDMTTEQGELVEERALELFDEDIKTAIEDQNENWENAREFYFEMMQDSDDYDESDYFDSNDRYMSDVAETWNISWPYWTGGNSNGGDRTPEDIADSLSHALGGAEVVAGAGYHGVTRKPGRWIIEPDGSLEADEYTDRGLEIVSPPMALPDALNALNKVMAWAKGSGDAYTNNSTGLHMGVSLPYKGGDVDYVKLILFMGDQYVLEKFGRAANTYCRSALEKLKEIQKERRMEVDEAELTGKEKTASAMDLMRNNLIELASRYVQNGVGNSKYTSAHIQDGYIEFRSPGGDYLAMNDKEVGSLEDTMLRFARAMYIAGSPEVERKEYAKKLYKLLDSQGDDALKLFLDYTTKQITPEELKKRWAQQVLATTKDKIALGNNEFEVLDVDTNVIGTVTAADEEEANKLAAEKFGGRYMAVRPKEVKDVKTSVRRARVAKNIAERPMLWHVSLGNQTKLVLARNSMKAMEQTYTDDEFYRRRAQLDVRPASEEEIKQWRKQQADAQQDSRELQQTTTGRLRVGDNNDILSAPQSRNNPDANWALILRRASGQLYNRPIKYVIANTKQEAMQKFMQEMGPHIQTDDNFYIVPVQPAGEPNIFAARGEWTGNWQIKDGQGSVLHTFGGVGNHQQDANRIALRWLIDNGYGHGTEIEVVPEMR